MVQVPNDHLKSILEVEIQEEQDKRTTILLSYLFTEKLSLLLVDFVVQVPSCDEKGHLAFKCISIASIWMLHFFTIAIFQLNKQGSVVHEVIEVGYDVVVLEDGEYAYFVHDVSALLFGE